MLELIIGTSFAVFATRKALLNGLGARRWLFTGVAAGTTFFLAFSLDAEYPFLPSQPGYNVALLVFDQRLWAAIFAAAGLMVWAISRMQPETKRH